MSTNNLVFHREGEAADFIRRLQPGEKYLVSSQYGDATVESHGNGFLTLRLHHSQKTYKVDSPPIAVIILVERLGADKIDELTWQKINGGKDTLAELIATIAAKGYDTFYSPGSDGILVSIRGERLNVSAHFGDEEETIEFLRAIAREVQQR